MAQTSVMTKFPVRAAFDGSIVLNYNVGETAESAHYRVTNLFKGETLTFSSYSEALTHYGLEVLEQLSEKR